MKPSIDPYKVYKKATAFEQLAPAQFSHAKWKLNWNSTTFETLHFRYTLLVGRPPFETMSLKDTYTRIKTNQYVIPSRISKSAAKLIQKFLSNNPQNRPCLHTVCETDEFFVKGFVPSSLPSSCCMVPPRFTALHRSSSNSEQRGTIKPASNNINYVLTKLQLNDGNKNERSKWFEKETKSFSSSPTQGKIIIYSVTEVSSFSIILPRIRLWSFFLAVVVHGCSLADQAFL